MHSCIVTKKTANKILADILPLLYMSGNETEMQLFI